MKKSISLTVVLLFLLIIGMKTSNALAFGESQRLTINGEIYNVKFSSANYVRNDCAFWVWKGTADSYTGTAEREKTGDLLTGQDYNFVTFPLKLHVNSCAASSTMAQSSASVSLSASSGGTTCQCQETQCSDHSAKWCSGNEIRQCTYNSATCCWKEGSAGSCEFGCENGQCKTTPDQCTYSGTKCYGKYVYECKVSSGGFKQEFEVQLCPGECMNGQCIQQCVSHYTANCKDGNVWWIDTCGNFEGVKEYCGSGQKCLYGQCVADCISQAKKKCFENRPYWYDSCDNKETPAGICNYSTQKCENGECVQIYNNECSEGQIKCINDNSYIECKYMSTYAARRWYSEAKYTSSGQRCENNQVVSTIKSCPYECCVASSGYSEKTCPQNYVCADNNKCTKVVKCGDSVCDSSEGCSTCPLDCGQCKNSCSDACLYNGISCCGNNVCKCEDINGDGCKEEQVYKECKKDCFSGKCVDDEEKARFVTFNQTARGIECTKNSDCPDRSGLIKQVCNNGKCVTGCAFNFLCQDDEMCDRGWCTKLKCYDNEYAEGHQCNKYECSKNIDCSEKEICVNRKCTKLSCSSNYVINHQCAECISSDECDSLQACQDNKCKNILCEDGFVRNHQCIKYECVRDSQCNDFEKCDLNIHKCIAKSDCIKLIDNGNSKDKLDILIIGAGYSDYNKLKEKVLYLFDKNGYHNSFFSVEPYKSNFNKFNIWIVKAPDFRVETSSSSYWCGRKETRPIEESVTKYESKCPAVDNTIVISDYNFRSYAYICGDLSFNSLSCYPDNKQARLILHEFGHSFGCLYDEYTESGVRDDPGQPNCAPDLATAKKWWGDLEGVEGVNYYTGISTPGTILTRNEGCSYTPENVRPTLNSIMKSQTVIENDYEPVNERWLRKRLEAYK